MTVKPRRPMGGPVLLSSLLRIYLTERQRRGEIGQLTVDSIRSNLRGVIAHTGDPESHSFTRRHVERWLEDVDLAPATVRTRLSQLRCFCSWAVQRGYMKKDPTLGVRPPRQPRLVPRGLRREEVQALLRACPDARTRLIVLLMVQEGLRRKEVAGLTLGDIDFGQGLMLVKGKGGHERVLPLSVETTKAIDRYLRRFPATAGPLLRRYDEPHAPLQPVTVGRLVSELMTLAGVKHRPYDGRSAHAARHTAATDMLRAGAHLRDVQQALGHRSITSTERYMPWCVGELRQAMGGRSYTSPLATESGD